MPRPCSICYHAQRHEIERDILAGRCFSSWPQADEAKRRLVPPVEGGG